MNGTHLTVIGNLTRTPILRCTAAGQSTTSFSVAVNRRLPNKSNNELETKQAVSFFSVVAWGQLAENVVSSLVQGDRVVVHGRLDQRAWTTNGERPERRTTYEIVADEVSQSLRWCDVALHRTQRIGALTDATSRIEAMISGEPAVNDGGAAQTDAVLVLSSSASAPGTTDDF